MKLKHKLLAGMAGTTAMSVFSYTWSRVAKRQFREPKLLSLLLEGERNKRAGSKGKTKMFAWPLHYLTGALFSLGYTNKLLSGKRKEGLRKGTLMGALDGVIGIGIWNTVFKLHPRPPKIARKDYLLHLFLAHLVFGWFTSRTLLYLGEQKAEDRKAIKRLEIRKV